MDECGQYGWGLNDMAYFFWNGGRYYTFYQLWNCTTFWAMKIKQWIVFYFTEDWTTTTRHEITRKQRQKRNEHREPESKEPKDKRSLLPPDLKPSTYLVKTNNSAGKKG